MLNSFFRLLVLFIGSPILFFACSKGVSTSQISIDFSATSLEKNSGLTAEFQFIVIQISGEGLNEPIYLRLDCDSHAGCGAFNYEVPVGAKFIQVFAVLEENDLAKVYYAGKLHQLETGEVRIPVALEFIANGNSEFAGQYIPSAGSLTGSKLTGAVAVRLIHGNHPPLFITSFEVFAGWFETFVLDSIDNSKFRLQYLFSGWDQTGQQKQGVLFNDIDSAGLHLASSGLLSSNQRVMKVDIPGGFEPIDGGTLSEPRAPESLLFGFLGQGASGKSLCWTEDDALTLDGDFGDTLCVDAACGSHVSWPSGLSSSILPNEVQFSHSGAPPAVCPNATGIYDSTIAIEREGVVSGDSDKAVFFAGPFRGVIAPGGGLEFPLPPDQNAVGPFPAFQTFADLPPGLTYQAFRFPGHRDRDFYENRLDGGIDCQRVAADFSSIPITYDPVSQLLHLNFAGVDDDDTIALCVLKPNGTYFRSAIYDSQRNSDPDPPGATLQLSMLDPANGNNYIPNLEDIDHMEFPPTLALGPAKAGFQPFHYFYLELKNTSDEPVRIDPGMHIVAGNESTISLEYLTNALYTTSEVSNRPDSNICSDNLSLAPDQNCHVKLKVYPNGGSLEGATFYTHLDIPFTKTQSSEEGRADLYMVAPVIKEFNDSATLDAFDSYLVAEGNSNQFDVKFVLLKNTTGGTQDYSTGLTTGTVSGNFSFEFLDGVGQCGAIANNEYCPIKLKLEPNDSAVDYSHGFTFAGNTWNIYTFRSPVLTWDDGVAAALSLSDGDEVDYGAQSSSVLRTLTFANNYPALGDLHFVHFNMPGSPQWVTGAGPCAASLQLTTGTPTCTKNLSFDPSGLSSGQESFDSIYIFHNFRGTHRDFHGFVRGEKN